MILNTLILKIEGKKNLVWSNISVRKILYILSFNLFVVISAINLREACAECSTACNMCALHDSVTLAVINFQISFVARIIIFLNKNSTTFLIMKNVH